MYLPGTERLGHVNDAWHPLPRTMGTFAGNREGKDMAKLVLTAPAACKGVGGGSGGVGVLCGIPTASMTIA